MVAEKVKCETNEPSAIIIKIFLFYYNLSMLNQSECFVALRTRRVSAESKGLNTGGLDPIAEPKTQLRGGCPHGSY